MAHLFSVLAPSRLLGQAALPQPTRDAIHGQLEDIFARPEFSPSPGPTWLAKLIELFVDLVRWLSVLQDVSPVLFWLMLLGAIVLLILLLAHITWTVRRVLYSTPRQQTDRTREQRLQLSQTFRDEAGHCAERGDFTEAIRCLFLALVYHFDETGRVGFNQACTNREYLGLLVDSPMVQANLGIFVAVLDDNWYGQRPTPGQRYQQCKDLFDQLQRSAAGR